MYAFPSIHLPPSAVQAAKEAGLSYKSIPEGSEGL